MITRYALISLFLVALISPLYGQINPSDNVLRDEVNKFGQADVTIAYPGREATGLITKNVSITSVRGGKVYISLSKLTVEWFLTAKFEYTIIPRAERKGMITAASVNQAMDWQSYPTYSQYLSIMKNFAASYPFLCRLDTIGTSINGQLMLALKISDHVNMEEDEPQVFYSSTIHGDELGGFVLMQRLADYLLKNYGTDQRARNLVDNLEIWINPLANPDGSYNHDTTVNSAMRYNSNGYDLNRNFPDPADPGIVYQKETNEMVSFMKKHRFVISANFHAGDEVVNYPWDRWQRLHADNDWFNYISRMYADTVHKYSVSNYLTDFDNGVTNGYAWYSINGGRQDYMTYERQGREVTIELDYTKVTPVSQLDSLWKYNWKSLLGYLENALYGIHGHVKDASSTLPVAAKVYINGHDKDSSQVYSDSINGSFTRMLLPGIWNLTFSARGYMDTTISNIVINPYSETILTVNMEPVTTPVDTNHPFLPYIWPNPGSSEMKCVLPDFLSGTINITFIDRTGRKIKSYLHEYLQGDQIVLNVDGLPSGVYYIDFRNISTGISRTSRIIVSGINH